jgi:hypothetical protein
MTWLDAAHVSVSDEKALEAGEGDPPSVHRPSSIGKERTSVSFPSLKDAAMDAIV